MLSRFTRALPTVASVVKSRALSGPTLTEQLGTVKDVKIKDIPQWASKVQKDPKTSAAVKFWNRIAKNCFAGILAELPRETGSAAPIFHVIGIMFTFGYANDYYCHLRHEGNYKYH